MIPSFDVDNVGNEEVFPQPISWFDRISYLVFVFLSALFGGWIAGAIYLLVERI